MSRTITVVYKHQLGVERIKQSVDEHFAAIKTAYIDKIGNVEMTWVGDTAEVRTVILGQKATAEVVVTEHDVTIRIQLPWLISGLSGTIESILRNQVDLIDAKQQPPASGAPH